MAGLTLGVGGYGAYGAAANPVAANYPEAATINQKAFGIGTSQTDASGPATAGLGTVAIGTAAAILLTWIWWTLPR